MSEKAVAAQAADLDEIMNIFDGARAFMGSLGNPQWQDGYPFRADIEERIVSGHMYKIMCGGRIAAVFSAFSSDEDYKASDIKWLTGEGEYLVIHNVAVSQNFRGQGFGRAVFAEAEDMARARAKKSVRLDTHEKNVPMRSLAASLGYTCLGVVLIRGNRKRLAYEKLI